VSVFGSGLRIGALTVSAAVATVALAACGASGGAQVASLGGNVSATDSAAPALSAADREAALRKFSVCMRDNGVAAFPDPTVDSDGNARITGMRNLNRNDPTVQKAMQTCRPLIASLRQSFTPQQRQQVQDALLKYAQCMRKNGYDMPDPNFSGASPGAGGGGGFFGNRGDRNDPNFQKADSICRPQTLSGLPNRGGFGGGFGGGPGGGPGGSTT